MARGKVGILKGFSRLIVGFDVQDGFGRHCNASILLAWCYFVGHPQQSLRCGVLDCTCFFCTLFRKGSDKVTKILKL